MHHDTGMRDPARYFGCFMADPAEYWYGQGFIKFLSSLRDSGQWQPASDRIAIVSTPEVGCQTYNAVHHYAIAAAVAGGTAGPNRPAQNRKIARILLDMPYRSVSGTIRYHPHWQAAVPYPDATLDPSLGIPHLFYQLRGPEDPAAIVAPDPYRDSPFELPPWFRRE